MRQYREPGINRNTRSGPPAIPKILISAAEVAESLAVSTSLVFRWIREGRLRAVRHPFHQLVRIRPEDVERFLMEEWRPVDGPIRPARGNPSLRHGTRGRSASR
jgi:excisionase family DNA binding protein